MGIAEKRLKNFIYAHVQHNTFNVKICQGSVLIAEKVNKQIIISPPQVKDNALVKFEEIYQSVPETLHSQK